MPSCFFHLFLPFYARCCKNKGFLLIFTRAKALYDIELLYTWERGIHTCGYGQTISLYTLPAYSILQITLIAVAKKYRCVKMRIYNDKVQIVAYIDKELFGKIEAERQQTGESMSGMIYSILEAVFDEPIPAEAQ